MKQLPLKEK
jgi:hypothetical protein